MNEATSPPADEAFVAALREQYSPPRPPRAGSFDQALRRRRKQALGRRQLGVGMAVALLCIWAVSGGDGPDSPRTDRAVHVLAAGESSGLNETTAFVLAIDALEDPEPLTSYLDDEYMMLDAALFGQI